MANENNDICEIVKKCKILLLDIEGTTTSISFVKDKLFPYAEENVKDFLDKQWDNDEVKEAVSGLRKLAIEDQENKVDGVVIIPGEDTGKDEQIEGLVKSVKWQMSADRKVGPLKQLQGLIWKLGYDKGDIKGHVYDDVLPALEQWRSVEGQKVYIYSSGSVQAQKLLFGQSVAGDLLPMIEGHFDTAVGAKQEAASYATIAEKIGCKPDEILFLTDIVKEAEAARASGLQAVLVSREGNAPLPAEATSSFPVLHSFEQLTVTNKRKPDQQVEEVPAKVPKTDIEDNVKSSSDTEETTAVESNGTAEKPTTSETSEPPVEPAPVTTEEPAKTKDEPEKMDVEEEIPTEKVSETDKPAVSEEKAPVCVETVVEEITDPKETVEGEVCEMEAIVEESTEKTEKPVTEKMEAESEVKNVETVANEPKETTDKPDETPVAEETPPTVITEIEEVNDQETLNEVAEIIEDLEPVVEEPPAVEDMEELQSVGEVLEKECDEILSKVQDVTNLDNIPIKPLLNTITEEDTIEAENIDSNDIVERILDTEMELGIKSCEDIDLNTVQEITDNKTPEENSEKEPKEPAPDTKTSNNEEENKIPEKVEKSNETDEVKNLEASPKPTEEKTEPVSDATDAKVDKESTKQKDETKPDTPKAVQEKVEENNTTTEAETVTEDKQVNGKTTNGDSEVNQNGIATDELNSRLSAENGKEVNGANGDTIEKGQGDGKETEVSDIKVKSVVVEEPRTDPVEQPTQA